MDPANLVAFVVILTLNAFFCAAETAITAASVTQLQIMADRGHRRARMLLSLLEERPRVVAALLIGQNVVGAVLAVFSTMVIDQVLGELMAPWVAALCAVLLSIVLLLVFGEVVPKSLAVSFATPWSLAFAWPVWFTTILFWPVTWVLKSGSQAVLRLLGRESDKGPTMTVEEIQTIARMGRSVGAIDDIEGRIIQSAAELNDVRVKEIMTPRVDVRAIPVTITLPELRKTFEANLYSRMPVYLHDLDDVVGILNFKEILRLKPQDEAKFRVQDYLHPALFVPATMFCGNLLEKLREKRTHLAIVIDEYGGNAGLVTLEDVIEQLVGRVEDEYDVSNEMLVKLPDGGVEVDGRLGIEEFSAQLGLKLSDDAVSGVETVAGLALKAFGKIPAEGEVIAFHDMVFTVVRMRDRRLRKLRVKLPDSSAQQVAELAALLEPGPLTTIGIDRAELARQLGDTGELARLQPEKT